MSRWITGAALTRVGSQPIVSFLAHRERDDLVALKGLIEAGTVRPVIDRRYPFEQIPEAIRYLETGHARGKVVITMPKR